MNLTAHKNIRVSTFSDVIIPKKRKENEGEKRGWIFNVCPCREKEKSKRVDFEAEHIR